MSRVRVRFAPSPTGFFHIGSARTALFNWLYARHTDGVFVLRIEDTDKERNSEEYLNLIYDSLSWLGLNWDEGPRVGGGFGPYRQSERAAIYTEYLEKLKSAGRTYEKDGATYFKLEGERSEVYDEHRKKTVTKVKVAPTVIEDQIRGRVERVEDEDFVIVRSDGNPVFHFVNVVDDIAMEITHVIRGEDHLMNTPKHLQLIEAFGGRAPQYAHIPLILNPDGSKMSKRDAGAAVGDYPRQGFLSAAVANFVALLGWNPKTGREIFTLPELVEAFSLENVNRSPGRFDLEKCKWVNQQHLLNVSLEDFAAAARPFVEAAGLPVPENYQAVIAAVKDKVRLFGDVPAAVDFLLKDDFENDAEAVAKVRGNAAAGGLLASLATALDAISDWSADAAKAALAETATAAGAKPGQLMFPLRVALSGRAHGPDLGDVLDLLGKDRCVKRVRNFAGML